MRTFVFLVAFFVGSLALEFEENDGHMFEGDIILTHGQRSSLDMYGDPTVSGSRGITADPTKLWSTLIVPYNVSSELENTPEAMAAIHAGIREWEERSCLKFVRRTTEKNYLDFFKGSGCWSYVGQVGGLQQLSLASGCWHVGTVSHEIGHAMGIWHEQSRPDRDQYVTIVWDNIPEKKRHNFNKYSTSKVNSLGVPYDYLSVMHYSETAFSSNGKPTIIATDPSAIQLGQRVGLSDSDVKQIDLLYQCNGKTTRPLTPPVGNPPPAGPDTCTFDTMGDLCGFTNDNNGDSFDWTPRLGKTPSGQTGPVADHTTGRWGWFMYIEASSPRVQGDKAVLRSKTYPVSPERCLHFYYHMFGNAVGSLEVSHSANGLLWSRSGNQNDAWHRADVQIPASPKSSYQITFTGVRGSGYQGDIAIDDIYFTDGRC